MTQQASQEALLALELFRLAPISKRGRDLLELNLVEVALYTKPKANSISEIAIVVSELLQQPGFFSENQCKQALAKGCENNGIQQIEDNKYKLSDIVKKELKNRAEKLKDIETSFDKSLIDNVGRALGTVIDPFAETFLCSAVKEVIQLIFFNSAIKFQRFLDSECDLLTLTDEEPDFDNEFEKRLSKFLSLQVDASLDKTIIAIKQHLNSLEEAERHFVANLHRRVRYFQILNIDPRLQRIQQECFENMRIYLDTNVVIRYLCDGVDIYRPIAEILELSKSLGAKLFISPVTYEEVKQLIDEASNFRVRVSTRDNRLVKLLQEHPGNVNNPIIDGFIKQSRIEKKFNLLTLLSPLKRLETHLLAHEVLIEDEYSEDIESGEEYRAVYSKTLGVKPGKSSNVLRHDTINCILIHKLRDKYPGMSLGPSVWLITIDTKLPVLDRRLRRKYHVPHCKLIENWGEVLSHFQNVNKFMVTDDYIAYLISNKLGGYIPEESLDIHVLETLANSEIPYEIIMRQDPEIAYGMIVDIQEDRETRALLDELTIPSDKSEEIISLLAKKITEIEGERVAAVTQEAEMEISRLKNGIAELERRQKELYEAGQEDREAINIINQKLEDTTKQLETFRKMPLKERLKFLFQR